MMDQDQIEKEKSKGTKSVHFQSLDQIKIEQEVELETLFEKDLEDFMAMNPTSTFSN